MVPNHVRQTVIQLLSGHTAGKGEHVTRSQEGDVQDSPERQPIHLQEREKTVLSLLLEGLSLEQIAATLGASNQTVEEIIRSILERFQKATEG